MATLRGHLESGRIVVDEPIDLPDGTEVEIADDDDMTPEERAEIEASIDRLGRSSGTLPIFLRRA